MKAFLKKFIAVLGFVLFFALFPPETDAVIAFAKDVSQAEPEDADSQAEKQAQIKLNVKTKALVKDIEYVLKVYNLSETQKASFKSSDPEIATVDENGTVLGISNGSAVITVTVKEGIKTVTTLTCDVTVGPPAISVKWTKSEILLVAGQRTTLKTIILPYNTTESAKFYSADPEIAAVSSTGKISAKAIGATYVFTNIDNGKYDFCKVTVVDEETYQNMLNEAASAGSDPDTSSDPDEAKETDGVKETDETKEADALNSPDDSDNSVIPDAE